MLLTVHALSHFVDEGENRSEVGWSVKIDSIDSMFVSLYNTVNAINFGVEYVSIQGKTVISLVGVRRDSCSKAENRDHLVTIVVLKDVTNGFDGI